MVFDQTIYVGNTAAEKIYVRTTYEKWQQLKFSTEVKLLSGGVAGGGVNFEQARDFTEGFTALAPHHTLKMIGSFFSAEADLPPPTDDEPTVEKRQSISRNYRVPNKHSIIVTPQHTVQVVRSGDRWKKQCMETCVFMIRKLFFYVKFQVLCLFYFLMYVVKVEWKCFRLHCCQVLQEGLINTCCITSRIRQTERQNVDIDWTVQV